MRRPTIEATTENVLESIKNNTYGRNKDVAEFIQALYMIEGNAFISLDAKWGDGKTFFVRQIEQTLNYLILKEKGEVSEEVQETYKGKKELEFLENKMYLPFYYNAWLYDNHNDPLLSLLLIVVKSCESYVNTTIDTKPLSDKLLSVAESLAYQFTNGNHSWQAALKPSAVKDAFQKKDILESVKTAEEIRECIKTIFDMVIVERAEKLVIFIDELDRCRPSYAIEMLERVKHYFDDERIIFVFSVNKEQLVHTISKYYGDKFDSTGYLNKFFDFNVFLPELDPFYKDGFSAVWDEKKLFRQIAMGLNDYYRLSLRDHLIYKAHLESLVAPRISDYTSEGRILSIFIPVIVILDILDVEAKTLFIQGKGGEILEDLLRNIDILYDVACGYDKSSINNKGDFGVGCTILMDVYRYIFANTNNRPYNGTLHVSDNLKKTCLDICNKFKK